MLLGTGSVSLQPVSKSVSLQFRIPIDDANVSVAHMKDVLLHEKTNVAALFSPAGYLEVAGEPVVGDGMEQWTAAYEPPPRPPSPPPPPLHCPCLNSYGEANVTRGANSSVIAFVHGVSYPYPPGYGLGNCSMHDEGRFAMARPTRGYSCPHGALTGAHMHAGKHAYIHTYIP